MAVKLSSPPLREEPIYGSHFARVWEQWFKSLSRLLESNSIPWTALDLTDSDHEDLSTFQGGTTDEHYHLTAAEYTALQRADNVASVSDDTTLDDGYRTVLVTASAKTITMPAASSSRIGNDWTVVLATSGYVTITPAGSDTFENDEGDTDIVLDERGATLTLRCITATSWAIV